MAEALYRKYRPQVFEDVVGQEAIERTLKNAIRQDKVSHAYLFTGPRGTGKTTTARLLAKALLCQTGPTPDPDGTCEDCALIAEGTHPDVYELDAASRTGVENVREEIISRVSFAPTRGRFKVYIIDEVHMLSTAAFNALLKTLEEPPSHVVFVLCTTDPQKVPETIHSRCQRFDFRRIAPEAMVSRLGAICIAEGVEFEGEALDLIAHRAEGGLRNALTSLEQIIAFENGAVTLAGAERLLGSIDSNDMAEIIAYVGKRDIANCFRWTASYVETGADLAQFVRDMAEHVRNLYVMALVGEDVELDIGETSRLELVSELQWFGADRLARLLGVLGDLSAELKTSSNPRLAFEIALTRMVRPDSDLTLESLAERVEALESGYSAVAHVLPGQPFQAPSAMSGGSVGTEPVPFDPSIDMGVQVTLAPTASAPRVSAQSAPAQVGGFAEDAPAERATRAAEQVRPAAVYQGVSAAQQTSAAQAVRASDSASIVSGDGGAAGVDAVQSGGVGVAGAIATSALANPAALSRIWQATLSTLKKQKQSYGVLFLNTKARFDESRAMVKVIFPEESAFVFNAVQKPDVQEALAAALEKAAGAPVPFMYEQAGRQVTGASAPMQAASASQVASTVQVTQQAKHEVEARQQPPQVVQADQTAQPQPQASQQRPQASPQQQPHFESRQQSAQPERADVQPTAQPQPQPQSQPQPQPQSQPQPVPSNDLPPYEQVPYEEVPYEEVPYEEFDGQFSSPGNSSQPDQAPWSGAVHDASTAPSPGEPNLTPDGALVEDPSDVEALLQAGFGGGVVFSEVNDDEM